jgi:hypothetical protein
MPLQMKQFLSLLSFCSFFLLFYTPSVSGQSSADAAKSKLHGVWQGKATVDFGFGYREEFEYELLLRQYGKKIEGYSTTVLIKNGKRYSAYAAVQGEFTKTLLKCRETHNVREDKMPNSSWVPFSKMELILKNVHNRYILEGLYQCPDSTGGRLILERKPPRV